MYALVCSYIYQHFARRIVTFVDMTPTSVTPPAVASVFYSTSLLRKRLNTNLCIYMCVAFVYIHEYMHTQSVGNVTPRLRVCVCCCCRIPWAAHNLALSALLFLVTALINHNKNCIEY